MSLFEMLGIVLNEDGWNCETDAKNQIVRLEIRGVNAAFYAFIIVDDEQESLLCNTHIKLRVPAAKHLEVCEFMNRVNYELANGNFEMDMEDGEIRFRTYLDLSGAEPSKEQILNLIWNGVQSFDNYYPGLLKIIHNGFTAEEAIRFCENSQEQDRQAY
ncbi:MAG: YbjN domain-containing protein [Desulfitobacteriaceae bacterium]